MQIVSDCEDAEKRGRFVFYREDQRTYLRSMVAWPMLNLRSADGRMTRGVISLDTNVAGYFRESDGDLFEFFLHEMAARLGFEVVLAQLLDKVPDAANS